MQPLVLSDEELVERLFFPVVNESCRILSEKIAIKASDLDISSVLGYGFPSYREFWGLRFRDLKITEYIKNKKRLIG